MTRILSIKNGMYLLSEKDRDCGCGNDVQQDFEATARMTK
jgi:hypothetical protein